MEGLGFLLIMGALFYWILSSDWEPVTQENIGNGSIVRLKSGGPEMTVEDHSDMAPGDSGVFCFWFNEHNDLKRGYFDAAMLEIKD